MTTILGRNNYGKSRVRLVRVARRPDRHDISDLTVDVALEGDFAAAHVAGDNSGLLATDTMRNTVYALARGFDVSDLERFGIRLVERFVAAGPKVTRARIGLVAHPWERLPRAGGAPPQAPLPRRRRAARARVPARWRRRPCRDGLGRRLRLLRGRGGHRGPRRAEDHRLRLG